MTNSDTKDNEQTQAEFYQRLEARLNDIQDFPSDYLFKFIVPNSELSVSQINQLISQYELKSTTKSSRNEKYISYSVNYKAQHADEIIEIYKAVSSVDKVIML